MLVLVFSYDWRGNSKDRQIGLRLLKLEGGCLGPCMPAVTYVQMDTQMQLFVVLHCISVRTSLTGFASHPRGKKTRQSLKPGIYFMYNGSVCCAYCKLLFYT
ncbi:hypothetical protein ATANTOWER_028010 [Ataeniobius toweri]|uniref:Uncharacterized protein n=1 Tax=Ataeniobius toweri TaxID=208326 RepID=A0ABU7B9Q5_9TELE|nr:hypothetical protein [Ataeniobius toweri]